jgi:hypothetical protein
MYFQFRRNDLQRAAAARNRTHPSIASKNKSIQTASIRFTHRQNGHRRIGRPPNRAMPARSSHEAAAAFHAAERIDAHQREQMFHSPAA